MSDILVNKIRCKLCGGEIESTHRHDFKWCSCGSVAVDGGKHYLKRCFKEDDLYEELSEFKEILGPSCDDCIFNIPFKLNQDVCELRNLRCEDITDDKKWCFVEY